METQKTQRLTQWLSKLVAFNTQNPGGDEVSFAAMLGEKLQAFKPDKLVRQLVSRHNNVPSSWVYACWGTPKLLINVHIDTVPANSEWAASPLELQSQTDQLVGLGAADIKGAIAALFVALESIGHKPQDCALLFSGDEERNSECMENFLKTTELAPIQHAIVCEPTGCQLGWRHRGILALNVVIDGVGGHSSLADHLTAPLLDLSCIAAQLGQLAHAELEQGPPGYKGICLNIANISGGAEYNIIPSRGQLTFSVRPRPGSGLGEIRKMLYDCVTRVAPRASLTELTAQSSFETHHLDTFEKFFPIEIRQPIDLPFWSEAALLAEHGINTIVYGPGLIEEAHKPNEAVPIEHLLQATNRFTHILLCDKS